ncbi:MAG: mechanosensitive ion channel [Bacteroidetes bacterium]|nr:mechanosensitive ion channel [Bacteroidota bacterium]
MNTIEKILEKFLVDTGINLAIIPYIRLISILILFSLAAMLFFWLTRRYFISVVYKLFKKTSFKWDDSLADHNVFHNVAHIVPAVLFRVFAGIIFHDFEYLLPMALKLTDIYLVVTGTIIVLSFLKATEYLLADSKIFEDKPIQSYFQLFRIVFYIAAGILILSILMDKSPIYLLSAFGALSAIVLLIFKDTILGLVASVQIASNDMVRVGDWVEMPKFNADGDVIAINLNTVKIRNWDKTVTTVPTYFFITDSFKNWRGMQESGGRRIKRALHINTRTIKFVDPDFRVRLKKYQLISSFMSSKQEEIETHNKKNNIDTSVLINGRRMTNIGVFRRYIEFYLINNKKINKGMTLLVRQLPIEDRGIPIEVYCFTTTTVWAEYEEIQSDLFDHLLAAATFFELEIYQQPSGSDIELAVSKLK